MRSHKQPDLNGAHDRDRTGEPLPYQGSALPTELRGLDTLSVTLEFGATPRRPSYHPLRLQIQRFIFWSG